jgi:hypothetical protein
MKSNTGRKYKADNQGWAWRPRADKYNDFQELTPDRAKKLFNSHPPRSKGETG